MTFIRGYHVFYVFMRIDYLRLFFCRDIGKVAMLRLIFLCATITISIDTLSITKTITKNGGSSGGII